MKQLPDDIRTRLARNPTSRTFADTDTIGDSVETDASDEDGRQGSPKYFSPKERNQNRSSNDRDESGQKDGKGNRIDFEA